MESSFTSLSTQVKASAGVRFIAYLIDVVVAYVPLLILGVISYRLSFIGMIFALVYFLVKDALPEVGGFLGGQSIGKKLMGIKAVREDTGAGLLGDYGTAITRQVSLMIPVFNIIDALMVLSDEKKRFGDKWAKTIVVKA
ncbi:MULTISPECIES: RDD family protein [Spirosoma]|uniref:RDD family protein n=1 Tax=Spirosoma sordidisoli TaxID=2502893 RepID=A0A4Q2UNQ9_9BACT|nr:MULTISPECIES: RDD family protein [Spirosoma]RYC69421.1 RDD family protein [Spirosoma sordidisoli]